MLNTGMYIYFPLKRNRLSYLLSDTFFYYRSMLEPEFLDIIMEGFVKEDTVMAVDDSR